MKPIVRWIHRRRPVLTAVVVLAALGHSIVTDARPADLLTPSETWRFWLPWALMIFGVAVRLWGSGNLRKNQEITNSGIYVLVRHPLYLGSLAFLLSYFLTVGDPGIGAVLFLILLGGIYYPTMRAEEEHLRSTFPAEFSSYRPPPRLLPDLSRFRESLESDRFDVRAAYRNLGFRSLWFLVGLPLFLRVLTELQNRIAV